MTQPNSFGLAYAVTVLRELARHLDETRGRFTYNAGIYVEAADLIEKYIEDNDITLLEIDNGDQTTKIETEEKDPTAPTDIGYDYERYPDGF